MNGLILGGTTSGVGKTIAALTVSQALSDAGYDPIPVRTAPDYVDPSNHAAALGRPSRTLDTWMQGVDEVRRSLARAAEDVVDDAITVVEGMMMLYRNSMTSTATNPRFAFELERGGGIDGDHDGLITHRTVGTYAHRHPACGAFDRLVETVQVYARG
jgi:cobyrinic acid a,c-diamide synthase